MQALGGRGDPSRTSAFARGRRADPSPTAVSGRGLRADPSPTAASERGRRADPSPTAAFGRGVEATRAGRGCSSAAVRGEAAPARIVAARVRDAGPAGGRGGRAPPGREHRARVSFVGQRVDGNPRWRRVRCDVEDPSARLGSAFDLAQLDSSSAGGALLTMGVAPGPGYFWRCPFTSGGLTATAVPNNPSRSRWGRSEPRRLRCRTWWAAGPRMV